MVCPTCEIFYMHRITKPKTRALVTVIQRAGVRIPRVKSVCGVQYGKLAVLGMSRRSIANNIQFYVVDDTKRTSATTTAPRFSLRRIEVSVAAG